MSEPIKDQKENHAAPSKMADKRFGCFGVLVLLFLAVILTAGVSILLFKFYFLPSEFTPVNLNPQEERALAEKIETIDSISHRIPSQRDDAVRRSSRSIRFDSTSEIEPEPYSEKGMNREIEFTERELNGMLAKNTDLAKKLAIDLSDDLISAKLILPVDEDFPIIGGKILRLRSGMVFTYTQGNPVVILKGITIMGVPLPNAWLGGIKNIDLMEKFGTDKGFWKTFSDGVENIRVEEGRVKIKLRE
ncbi:MAG: hypothetical protein R6X10_07465 [Desulfobacterales bacterium]